MSDNSIAWESYLSLRKTCLTPINLCGGTQGPFVQKSGFRLPLTNGLSLPFPADSFPLSSCPLSISGWVSQWSLKLNLFPTVRITWGVHISSLLRTTKPETWCVPRLSPLPQPINHQPPAWPPGQLPRLEISLVLCIRPSAEHWVDFLCLIMQATPGGRDFCLSLRLRQLSLREGQQLV